MITRFCERVAAKVARVGAAKLCNLADAIERKPRLSPTEREILARNRHFRNLHCGKRAFVIGNGPSLNRTPLENLKEELVFAVNGFACHDIIGQWQPFVLALQDPAYFSHLDVYAGEFERMRARLPNTLFFLPLKFRTQVESYNLLPAERCFYTHLSGSMSLHQGFSVDICRPVPAGQTVTLLAIMLCIYMGCDPIYLIGMDHDFLASPKTPTHFSTAYESTLTDQEKQNLTFKSWNYLKLIKAVELMFEGYVNLKEVAESRGQKILNATGGGYLDVFPTVDYHSLFSRSQASRP